MAVIEGAQAMTPRSGQQHRHQKDSPQHGFLEALRPGELVPNDFPVNYHPSVKLISAKKSANFLAF
jgi:hypothetical protein